MRYNPVTKEIVKTLQDIVGEKYVIFDAEKLEAYSHDEVTDSRYHKMPEAVVLPEKTEQVAKIVALANRELFPVVPRGGGTGLACGAVPVYGGVVISLERMNKILNINAENLYMIVEPGVRTEDVQQAAKNAGLFYAGDPCSGDSCFIGGNVATNAGGNRAVKYGTTRHQIYSVEVVTPTGEITNLGGKLEKSSTGYGLEQLIIGSEGTLGVVTKITLKLLPLPLQVIDLLAIFPTADAAIGIVPKMLKAGIDPTCIEFIDNATIKCIESFLQEKQPESDQGNYIIVQLEGQDEEDLENKAVLVDELCTDNQAVSVLVAESAKIWRVRKTFAEAVRQESLIMSKEDIVVPIEKIPEMITIISGLSQQYDLVTRTASHAGDGNIHLNILKGDMPEEVWDEKLAAFQSELYDRVYKLGGKLSGEHGIGSKRKHLMELYCDPVELAMMKAIKKALDPNHILNPGKIFEVDN